MNISVQKQRTQFLWTFALLLVLTAGTSITAQVVQPSSDASNGLSVLKTSPRRLVTALMAAGGSDGLRVTIGTSTPVDDAIGYRSGDRYVVVIPQSAVSLVQLDMRLLKEPRIETHDEDVVFSFKLDAGDARVTRENGGLVVALGASQPSAAVLNVSTSGTNASSNAAAAVNAVAAAAPAAPAGPPNIFEDIKKLFNTTSVDVANLDLSTPESPAFTVLGLTPQTIVRPASPREFASSLINGLDKNGNFQSGLAIDTAPFLLLNGRNITLEQYNQDRLTRFLTRTQFSLAAAKGSSKDDPTTKLSLGLNLTLMDQGDPRIFREGQDGDVLTCFQNKIPDVTDPPVPPLVPGQSAADRLKNEEEFRQAVLKHSNAAQIAEDCREEGRKKNWNKSSWTLAFAPSWISKTGNSSNFKWNGGAVWTSYALGVGDTGQFIVHGRYRAKEQVPDETKSGSFITQNSALFGGRYRMGNPNVGFNIEGAFVHNRPEHKPTKNTYEFSLGVEKKLAPNVYFVISAGSQGPQADGSKSHGFMITSFKYGFSDKPKLATQPN